MIPLLIPSLIGAGMGALTNRRDPLTGALIGGAAGAAGGHFMPELFGMSGAAGGVNAASGGLTAAPGSGLTLAAPAGGSAAGGLGLKAGAGLMAPNATAAASTGVGLTAPTAGFFGSGTATSAPGALAQLKAFGSNIKPVGEAAGAALAVKQLFQDDPMPVAQSSLPPRSQMDVSGLLGNGQVAQLQQKRMARRGLMG